MRDDYRAESVFFFGPDSNPWYRSLEHALLVERDRVSVLTRLTEEGEIPNDAPTILVKASFAQTYVWPVFRHLTNLGL